VDDLPTLIDRVRSGERTAFGQIVTRFQETALGYVTSQLGDVHAAEDAAQEAFLQGIRVRSSEIILVAAASCRRGMP
jgi:DNA-directed RNA polymerase specialized sigma24 family protein